jgi:uroporphyrinogen decarboxylase
MERITEILIIAYGNILKEIGQYVQVVAIGDDLGTQNGLLISPDIYRKRIKPRQKRLIDSIKSKTDAYIFYHTCGAIREFIPDLIEIGVDALNPIQVSAKGMGDTAELKRMYGKDLTFWGGLCDNQKVLPFGTPKEVREETRRRLEDMMAGGGYVAASIHCIQDEVPPENILAMFETVHEYGKY